MRDVQTNGGAMIDQVFEAYRKASESSMLAQQDLFTQWSQMWVPASGNGGGGATMDWGRTVQRRWLELMVEALGKHREAVDKTYRRVIEVVEQSLHLTEAKSPDEYRRLVDELGRKVIESFKAQTETQLRDFQSWAERSFEIGLHPQA
jgi:hypothetical protein